MAFSHGKATRVYANGNDLSQYLSSIATPGTADVAETTVFNTSGDAKTYVAGKKDTTLTAEGFFDGSEDAVDEILQTALGSTGNIWTWYPAGDAIGNYGYGIETIQNSYDISSPVDGVVSVTAEGQSYVGRDRVVSLHALAAETTDGEAASVDNSAGTTEGGIGYLQVTNVSTGSVTCKVQHSSAGSTWSDLISFAASTGGAERSVVAGSVKRYTRSSWTLSSSSGSATFNIGFRRK